MVVPPPMAAPCTAAMSGFSKSISAAISWACGDSPGPGGFFRKSSTSFPALKESPAPRQSTTQVCSSLPAALKISASATYMLEVIAFRFAGRFNSTRKMLPERLVTISAIVLSCSESGPDGLRAPANIELCRLCARDGAAGMKLCDLGRVEPELSQDLGIVLAEAGPAPCGLLRDPVHLHRTAHCQCQVAFRALE